MKHPYICSGLKRKFGDRNAWLKILALILIGMGAGPEIGFAMEMTTLLEILGVTIFFLSFRVGAKMLLMSWPNAIVLTATRTYWLVTTVLVTSLFGLELTGGLT